MDNKVINVIFWLLTAVAAVVGALCFVYNRAPEGCVILGSVAILVLMFFVLRKKEFKASSAAVYKAAGNLITQIQGSCRIDGGPGGNHTLRLCENGVCLCNDLGSAQFIKYSDIELQNSGSVHHIQFVIADVGICRFVCESKLKIKAVTQALESKKK